MTDNYEELAKEQIRKMQDQFKMMNPNAKAGEIINRQNTEQGLLKEDNESISNEHIDPSILKSSPPPTPAPTPGACPQCGTLHPPLRPGEKCPIAKVKVVSEKEGKDIDVNKYLNTFRDIIISQIGIKNIKDPDKLFKNITIELTKFLEGYSE